MFEQAMQVLKIDKTTMIRDFVKRIPKAESMAIDYGRDEVAVFFGVYTKYFKVSELTRMAVDAAKVRGYQVEFTGGSNE